MFAMKENVKPDNTGLISATISEPNFHSFSCENVIPPSSRPNSHHRRRSSVSTRRESAEMMGLLTSALSELPTQDDADTDSIRRHALWALEGRFENDAFSKVQIPELSQPESESKLDLGHLTLKNSFPHIGPFGNKRDSTGRGVAASLSSKDQLHTLVEEEEEEEEESDVEATKVDDSQPTDIWPGPLKSTATLKPLQLTSAHSVTAAQATIRNGLKPLTLATSPITSTSGSLPASKSNLSQISLPTRRSSLSYKRANDTSSSTHHAISNPLPTPELTPVTAERPLSPSEQAFLSSNQASLLSRISELERVLAVRTRSMSIGTSSSRQHSISSQSSEGPSDEMLCLLRDLKMERDDLKRDMASWRTHTTNLESQIVLLTQRVEKERCEVWEAKERLNALEMERTTLKRDLTSAHSEIGALQSALASARESLQQSTASLETERARRLAVEREAARLKSIHANRSQSFGSSNSSSTDCESELMTAAVILKTVPEEDEDLNLEDDDNELAHYEDEDEDDVATYSDDSFSDHSMGPSLAPVVPQASFNTLVVPPNGAGPLLSPTSAASSTPPHTPHGYMVTHARRSSLEQNWSFPKGAQVAIRQAPEVDRFFDCLELADTVADGLSVGVDLHEASDKYGFFRKAEECSLDDDLPFIIPAYRENAPLEMVLEEEVGSQRLVLLPTKPPAEENHLSDNIFSPSSAKELERSLDLDEDGPVGLQSTIDCATPRPSGLWTTPKSSPTVQTPRKLPRSSIPRLSPSSKKSSPTLPVTPISNPRPKGTSDHSRALFNRQKVTQPLPNTPTKVSRGSEQPRNVSNAYLDPSSLSTSTKLKPTGIAALANYLPWAGWAQSDAADSIYSEPRVTNLDRQSSTSYPLAHRSNQVATRRSETEGASIPTKRLPSVSQLKRSDKLFLL